MMENNHEASWSVLDDPWITTLCSDGSQREVSVIEAFEHAPEIKAITGDIPQQAGVIYRLLDAILRRALFVPGLTRDELIELWRSLWRRGSFDMKPVLDYLSKHRDAFDLFGPHPFYQIPGLTYDASKECDPVASFMADVPSKSEKFLFSLRGKHAPNEMSFAEATRWLIFNQAYETAGIKTPVVGNTSASKGKVYAPKGIPATGYLGNLGLVFLEGANLFETLMWNFVLFDDRHLDVCLFGKEDDLPPWELPIPSADSCVLNGPTGIVQLETMQSRRIRLVPSEDGTKVVGFVSCYGDMLHPVDAMRYETMTAKKQSEAQGKRLGLAVAPFMPKVHDASKAMWRGLSGLIAASEGLPAGMDNRPLVVRWMNTVADELLGFEDGIDNLLPKSVTIHGQGIEYGTQSSVFSDSYDDCLTIGSALVVDDEEAVQCAIDFASCVDAALFEVARLVRSVEESKGDKASKDVASARRVDTMVAAAAEIDGLFRSYLSDLTEDVDPYEYTAGWRSKIRATILAIGRRAVSNAGAQVFASHTGWSVSSAEAYFVRRVFELLPDGMACGRE